MSYFKPSTLGYIEQDGNTNKVLKRLVAKQPVAIAMKAMGLMAKYTGGVLTDDLLHCSSSSSEVNHGVVLVGYGKVKPHEDRVRGKCKEYWIIRNSWGADWGEHGTFKLCMDGTGDKQHPFGSCLVNKYGVIPNLEGTVVKPADYTE